MKLPEPEIEVIKSRVRAGTLNHRILLALQDGERHADTLVDQLKQFAANRGETSFINHHVMPLVVSGYIARFNDTFVLTESGKGVLTSLLPREKPEQATVRGNLFVADMSSVYSGRELRDMSSRPGAYDFRKHPSLINGKRV